MLFFREIDPSDPNKFVQTRTRVLTSWTCVYGSGARVVGSRVPWLQEQMFLGYVNQEPRLTG